MYNIAESHVILETGNSIIIGMLTFSITGLNSMKLLV